MQKKRVPDGLLGALICDAFLGRASPCPYSGLVGPTGREAGRYRKHGYTIRTGNDRQDAGPTEDRKPAG